MPSSFPGTLSPNQVATATVDTAYPYGITIKNLTGSGRIWYRLDGADPVPMQAGTHVLSGSSQFIPNPVPYNPGRSNKTVAVKLLSDQALDYTVEGNPAWSST